MKKLISTVLLVAIVAITSCSDGHGPTPPPNDPDDPDTPPASTLSLVKGADVSWLSQMEAEGIKFFYSNGQQGDCIDILKGVGINTLRFRLWVNPSDSYNSTSDVMEKAVRAKMAGMDIMLDFHYSDSWADPSKQTIPTAWEGLDLPGLVAKVSDYTSSTLRQFKQAGIDVKYVQVGNETGNGMLWPYGQADKNPQGYAQLNNAGYDAVKSVYPDAKVIVHIQNGQDASLHSWLFGVLHSNGGKWDVCGMSLYPGPNDYATYITQCKANMQALAKKYSKPSMLCEIGMGNSYTTQCYQFITQCLDLKKDLGDTYLGVLYWEPQVYNDWNGYKLGAFTSSGRPSDALTAFK